VADSLIRQYECVRQNSDHPRLHEIGIQSVYEAVLQPGDTVIDGGAHSGKHTIPMAHAVGSAGRVFAFEPSPKPYGRLSKNLAEANEELRDFTVGLRQRARSRLRGSGCLREGTTA
jgi:precorrin-6B methylase 2